MGKGYRQGRLGEEIRRIISDMLFREIKDPRLTGAMISITGVEVTPDGSHATVYVSPFDIKEKREESDEEKADVLEGLDHCKGMIRKEIGKQMRLRHTPEITFKIDRSMGYGNHMDRILDGLGVCHDEGTDGNGEDHE